MLQITQIEFVTSGVIDTTFERDITAELQCSMIHNASIDTHVKTNFHAMQIPSRSVNLFVANIPVVSTVPHPLVARTIDYSLSM